MPLTKAKKAEKIEQLTKELTGSTSAIVGSFSKLTVSQDFELRKVVRGAGGRYRVLKNKLAARASKGTGVEAALQGLKGVSSVAYTSGDPVALAKALSTWVTDNAEFSFRLGIVEGKVISIEEIKQLATMPAKEEIYAKLLFLISSPAQRLATVINATGRDLAVVINQGVEKGKFAAAAVVAAAVVATPAPVEATKPPVQPAPEPPAVEAAAIEAAVADTVVVAEAPVEDAPLAAAEAVATAAAESPAAVESASQIQAVAAGAEDPVEGAPAAEDATAEAAPGTDAATGSE
jgi:large subunit ribosomal protein L10